MSTVTRFLANRPVIVGNVVKAVIGLGALAGLAVTDAATEAIVGVVIAVLALIAAITAGEQKRVTPVTSAAKLAGKSVEETDGLLRSITKGLGL